MLHLKLYCSYEINVNQTNKNSDLSKELFLSVYLSLFIKTEKLISLLNKYCVKTATIAI